jgi:hypothetical protein
LLSCHSFHIMKALLPTWVGVHLYYHYKLFHFDYVICTKIMLLHTLLYRYSSYYKLQKCEQLQTQIDARHVGQPQGLLCIKKNTCKSSSPSWSQIGIEVNSPHAIVTNDALCEELDFQIPFQLSTTQNHSLWKMCLIAKL